MNTSAKWIAVAIISVAFFGAMIVSEKNQLQSENYEKCLAAMQKAIPDPNDDGRASFLQDCQQN